MALERFAAANGGMNSSDSPDYVEANQAQLLKNLLTGRAGMVFARGPITRGILFTGSLSEQRIWSFGDKILFATSDGTHRSFDATGTSHTAAISPTTIAPAATITGPRHARVGDYVYGEVDGTTDPTLGKWDPSADTIVQQAGAPVGWTDVKSHLNRLWVLGGSVPYTTTPIKPLALYWSDPGATFTSKAATGAAATDIITSTVHGYDNGAQIVFTALTGGTGLSTNKVYYVITSTTNTFQVALTPGGAAVDFTTDITAGTVSLADWADNVSGLTNQIVVSGLDTPIGLARCGQNMAILMRRSIFLLTGSGASNFSVRLVSSEFGCTARGSIVEDSGGFYFASDRGYCYCDGATVQVVSRPILLDSITYAASAAGAAMLPNGYLYINYGLNATSKPIAPLAWLLDTSSGAWTSLSARLSSTSDPIWMHRTANYVWTTCGKDLCDATLVSQRTPTDLLSDAKPASGGGTTPLAIETTLNTRVAKLAGISDMSSLQRVLVDCKINLNTTGIVGPTVDVKTLHGDVVSADPINPDNGFLKARFRYQSDAVSGAECSDAYLAIKWTPDVVTTPGLYGSYELYDAGIEFLPAYQRGNI